METGLSGLALKNKSRTNERFSFKVIHRLTLRQGRGVNRESPLKLKGSLSLHFSTTQRDCCHFNLYIT